MMDLFGHFKISFTLQLDFSFLAVKTNRITKCSGGIQPDLCTIRQKQLVFAPSGCYNGIICSLQIGRFWVLQAIGYDTFVRFDNFKCTIIDNRI
ncbi:hypothetical protein D3C80_1381480 [compost metagenome]